MRGAKPERAIAALVEGQLDLQPQSTVVVACSGGPDSVALAELTVAAASRRDARVVLAHVNHGVRPSSDQDEFVVVSVAMRLNCAVRIARCVAERGDEAHLRELRYAALVEIARDCGATAIVTAHTAEDQTETVLLALFRGTGLEGIAGMPPRRAIEPGIDLVRPLLRVTHEQLRAEILREALPYALDPTNEATVYRRNALRAVLGELRREFPHLDASIARCSEIVRDELAGSRLAERRRAIRDRLRGAGELADVPFERIEAAVRAFERNSRARVFLKQGVEITGNDVIVRRSD
ncbi:MAG TPA: tRNA lysidine(34) synthetase TilS [Candidatus Binatia bacterium]|nr:tRNA lysidine(34) synthetase TilS [Candidatus Binatia bacterium]